MNIKRLIPIIISVILLNSCQSEEPQPSLERDILGNWLVVGENYDQNVVEWGFFYVGSVKMYEDHTFKVNLFDQPDDPNSEKHGTWQLNFNKSIVFNSYVEDFGTVLKTTTWFKVSFADNGKLVLENKGLRVHHTKLDN